MMWVDLLSKMAWSYPEAETRPWWVGGNMEVVTTNSHLPEGKTSALLSDDRILFNTSYLTDSYIVFTLKLECGQKRYFQFSSMREDGYFCYWNCVFLKLEGVSQNLRMINGRLRPFLVIFFATTSISFTKLRFRRSFWGAKQVWILIG